MGHVSDASPSQRISASIAARRATRRSVGVGIVWSWAAVGCCNGAAKKVSSIASGVISIDVDDSPATAGLLTGAAGATGTSATTGITDSGGVFSAATSITNPSSDTAISPHYALPGSVNIESQIHASGSPRASST